MSGVTSVEKAAAGTQSTGESRVAAERVSDWDEADRQRVNQAVQQAESSTSAEIVPVVARCSGRYDRGEDVVGLWLAALAMVFTWWMYPLPEVQANGWSGWSPVWQLVALLAAGLIGFLAGAICATRFDVLRRLFTPAVQMRQEVDRRAREVFYDQRIHHTRSGAGVLLYVSLFERKAAVIADARVLEQLGQHQIDQLCNELTSRLHEGRVIDALCDTLLLVGQRLAVVMPRQSDDVNELADALVVVD